MRNNKAVMDYCVGKKITSFEVRESMGFGGKVTIVLDDGGKLELAAWDDGGYGLGSLTMADGTVVGFCGGD